MYSGDEIYGDDVTSGFDPDFGYTPNYGERGPQSEAEYNDGDLDNEAVGEVTTRRNAGAETIAERRLRETRTAFELRANGASLFEIATKLGVSKDYLRERLGVR